MGPRYPPRPLTPPHGNKPLHTTTLLATLHDHQLATLQATEVCQAAGHVPGVSCTTCGLVQLPTGTFFSSKIISGTPTLYRTEVRRLQTTITTASP